jgi:hypothetical protein
MHDKGDCGDGSPSVGQKVISKELKKIKVHLHFDFFVASTLRLCDIAQKNYRLSFPIFQFGPIIATDILGATAPIIFRYGNNLPIIFDIKKHPLNINCNSHIQTQL